MGHKMEKIEEVVYYVLKNMTMISTHSSGASLDSDLLLYTNAYNMHAYYFGCLDFHKDNNRIQQKQRMNEQHARQGERRGRRTEDDESCMSDQDEHRVHRTRPRLHCPEPLSSASAAAARAASANYILYIRAQARRPRPSLSPTTGRHNRRHAHRRAAGSLPTAQIRMSACARWSTCTDPVISTHRVYCLCACVLGPMLLARSGG